MQLYQYKNYNQYVTAQKRKTETADIDEQWVSNTVIEYICSKITTINPTGICHGVRNGYEVIKFKELLSDSTIIGTEIANVKAPNPNTIKWDFHKVKPEWINAIDFIYSNSFDHTYNPTLCIKQWMQCLNTKGTCFIEWTTAHNNKCNMVDAFGASKKEYHNLFSAYNISTHEFNDRRNTTLFMLNK